MTDVGDIEALLPQTQCGECGYQGCRPYAEALAQGQAAINLCPPGGVETLNNLAEILQEDAAPLVADMRRKTRPQALAVIKEEDCIGCTKCIQACPVDAIVGSAKLMHSVIADECTGCGLCIDPCPVDCIDMVLTPEHHYDKDKARMRHQDKQVRQLRQEQEKQQAYRDKRKLSMDACDQTEDKKAKQDFILNALSRVKAKQNE